jgi:hypothetical protein
MFDRRRDSNSPLILLIGAFILDVLFVVIRYWKLLAR